MDNQYAPEGRPTKFCSTCGAKIDKEAEICPKCGVRQFSSPSFRSGYGQTVTPPPTDVDLTALKSLKNGSIIGIIGVALSLFSVSLLYSFLFAFTSLSTTASLSGIIGYLVVLMVGVILGIVSLVLYRHSFKDLMTVDHNSFKTPASFVRLFYIGLIIFIVALVVLVIGAAIAIGSLQVGFFLIMGIIAGILSFVAVVLLILGIIGVILGLWRAGTRYDNTLIKIGGILYIIPYASIIAPILVFIGANSVEKQMQSGGFQASPQQGSLSSGASTPPKQLPPKEDVAQKLNTLKTLHESGQISSEEYAQKRKELLDSL